MRCLAACLTVLLAAPAAHAQLKPEEVAILATATGRVSRQLADYYAKARGIPPSHVYLLDAKPGSDMTRTEWESKARPAIRAWLAANGLESKVRCLVTSWDVPLRIGRRPADSPIVTARKTLLAEARKAADATLAEFARSSMAWRPKKSGQTGRLLRKKLRRSSARSWTPPLGRRRSGSGQWGGAWRRNGRKRRSRRFS